MKEVKKDLPDRYETSRYSEIYDAVESLSPDTYKAYEMETVDDAKRATVSIRAFLTRHFGKKAFSIFRRENLIWVRRNVEG